MKEERVMILKMIEEGKISADDGVKLLNALKGENGSFKKKDFEEKFSKAAKSLDAFAKDFKGKVEEFAKDAEPKVKEASQVVWEKTASAFDDLSKTIKNIFETKDEKKNKNDDIIDDEKDINKSDEADDFEIEVENAEEK